MKKSLVLLSLLLNYANISVGSEEATEAQNLDGSKLVKRTIFEGPGSFSEDALRASIQHQAKADYGLFDIAVKPSRSFVEESKEGEALKETAPKKLK